MKAVLFDGTLRFSGDHPLPVPGEGEALIKVLLAGICNTDLEILKGYMGFRGVPGHEFVAVVEEVPDGPQELAGKRVVGEINLGCRMCDYCLSGMRYHCPHRTVLGILGREGAMAEYVSLPVENLHLVPEHVADEEAVFAEPLAAAFEVLEQTHIKPTDRVLIMGDGKLGLLMALVLRLTRADVSLLGKHEHKLAIARRQGIRTFSLKDFRAVSLFDVVVEATGSAEGFGAALTYVKPRGVLVLKSTVAGGGELNLAPLVVKEITVVGSRCGPFAPALRALSDRAVDVRPLVTGVYGFEKAREAFERAAERDSLKVLLDFR